MEFDFSRNYFELFELEVNYVIDADLLANNYQQLQSRFHPDRFVSASDQDRRIAIQATTFINEAHDTLRDEQTRARYLLQLQGVPFDSDQDTTQDMDFLMEQMMLREQIDEVDQQDEPLDRLDELALEAREQKNNLVQSYQQHYAAQEWGQAKETVLKLQFFARLQQQINNKQEALENELL